MAAECATERPWSGPLEEHLENCPECAAMAARWVRCRHALDELPRLESPVQLTQGLERSISSEGRERRAVGALALLEPLTAPESLEGRVVASLQQGFLQDRAAGEMRSLGAVVAPIALDDRLETVLAELREEGRLHAPPAPAELEERVAEDLSDLPAAISRGAMSKLERQAVPGELVQRVQRRLGAAVPAGRRSRAWVAGLAAAAALLIYAGLSSTDDPTDPGPRWAFRVEESASLDSLSPLAKAIAAPLVRELDVQGLALPVSSRVQIQSGTDAVGTTRPGAGPISGVPSGGSGAGRPRTTGGGATGGGTQGAGAGGGPGVSGAGGGSAPLSGFARFGPDYFNATIDAPFQVHYRGDRRVLTRTLVEDLMVEVDYREEVACDGQGKFTIKPKELLSPPMGASEEAAFMSTLITREGFFYRFRDFRVRDYGIFWRNYDVQHLVGQTEVVAGVVCERFDVTHESGLGGSYRVAIDPATSLVLSEEYRDGNGELVHKTWYETLVLGADLSDLQVGGASLWLEVDPQTSIGIFNDPLLTPSAPPSGYELQSFAYRPNATGAGKTWSRFVYSDGLQQVFFLSEDGLPHIGNGGSQAGVGPTVGDSVRTFSVGEWAITEGQIGGRYVLTFGKVDVQELLLMLQSAVE